MQKACHRLFLPPPNPSFPRFPYLPSSGKHEKRKKGRGEEGERGSGAHLYLGSSPGTLSPSLEAGKGCPARFFALSSTSSAYLLTPTFGFLWRGTSEGSSLRKNPVARLFLPSFYLSLFWVGRRKGTRKSLSILGIPLEEGSDCCCCGVLVFGVARNKPNTNPTQQQQPMSDSSLANRGVCASSNRTHPLFCWNRRIQPERESASENIRGGEEGMNENEPKHETRTQDSQWGEPSPRKRTGEKNGSDWGARTPSPSPSPNQAARRKVSHGLQK